MSSIREVFPADDQLSRFVMAMCIAGNDVQHALDRAFATAEQDDPAFGYYVRLALGHTFEGLEALQRWRQVDDVGRIISALSGDARSQLAKAAGTAQALGGKALEHSRQYTFHYPYPNRDPDYEADLEAAMREVAEEEAVIELGEGERGLYRFSFADRVAEALVFAKHAPLRTNKERLGEQMERASEGAIAFRDFVAALVAAYRDKRGLEFG